MRIPTSFTIAAVLPFALLALPAVAEKTDRDKPIRYSANSLDGNQSEGSVILNGKVEVMQGTILLRADRVVLKQQADGSYNATASGKPVTFRQKMDDSDEFVDAQALRIEYLGSKDLVELYEQGWIKRGKDEVRGSFLTYNSSNGLFAGRGSWPPAGTVPNPDGRVVGVIQPKPKDPATTSPSPSSSPSSTPAPAPAPASAKLQTATPVPGGAKLQTAPAFANPPKE